MQLYAHLVHVVEEDFPLVQLGGVEAPPLGVAGPHPGIGAIAAVDVVGQEVDAVDALTGEVVDGADDALALAALPGGVAGIPVGYVVGILVQAVVQARRGHASSVVGAVELVVGQEVLGAVGPALEEVLTRLGELQLVLADVLEHSLAAEIIAGLVGGGDGEAVGCAVEEAGAAASAWAGVDGDVGACAEGGHVAPGADLVGHEVYTPLVAAGGAGLGRVAVGCVVAGHVVGLCAGPGEGDDHSIIREGVGGGRFVGGRPVEGDRHVVPGLQLAGDHAAGGVVVGDGDRVAGGPAEGVSRVGR